MADRVGRQPEGALGRISRHQDLQVYQHAFDVAVTVFELTKRFPRDEEYSLTDQIRRSSRSVCANIVEAWRKRRFPAAFVSKLALRCGYLNPAPHDQPSDRYDHICAQLIRMINAPEKWCIPNIPARR